MDFVYYYKTADNVRHEGEIGAPSRDEAFAALRELGIRPIKLMAKDGSRSNGEVRGVRKRVVAALALSAALLAAAGVWLFGRGGEGEVVVDTARGPVTVSTAQPLPRQMIPGDRMRIERMPTNLFVHPLEFHLARYAEPGRKPGAEVAPSPLALDEAAIKEQLASPVRITSEDFTEHVDLKRIVAGMKREMRAYVAGGGTARGYFDELVKRQKQEMSYREKAESRLAAVLEKGGELKAAYDYWLKANASLKSMGIYELPLPDALNAFQLNLDLDE